MKTCSDFLGSAGSRVPEEHQILHWFGSGEHDSVMVSIVSRFEPLNIQDVTALLLYFESRLESAKAVGANSDGTQPRDTHIANDNHLSQC